MHKYRLVINDYSRQFFGGSMLHSPKVFLCAPRIMRSDFEKLNCDNIIIKSRPIIFVTQDDRNERLKAARTRYSFFPMIVIPCFEVQLSKAVDHLIRSLPTLFLRSFKKKPDHGISKKPIVVINALRTADIFINPVAVLSMLFYWPTMNA